MKAGTSTHRRPRSLRALAASAAVIALAVLALLPAGAAPAPAESWRPCGADNHREAGWFGVLERGTTCHQARRLARRWWHANPTWGFTCTLLDHHQTGRVLCHRNRAGTLEQIRFSYTASA